MRVDLLKNSKKYLPALVILAAAFALFANTFSNQWLMDDIPVIVENPDIRSIGNFFENAYPGRPLREITYLLDYAFFGLRPAGYHIQQILWHALNACLVFLLAIRITGERRVAWIASLLFLAHPLTVEVVANVSHRKDSLALAFILLSVLTYTEYFRRDKRRMFWLALAMASGLVAFSAKQNAAVLPLLWAGYELAFVPEPRRLLLRNRFVVPAGLVAACVGPIAWFAYLAGSESYQRNISLLLAKMGTFESWTMGTYLRLVLKSSAVMLAKVLYPVGLSMEYVFPAPQSWFDPWVLFALVVFAVVVTLLVLMPRRVPVLFFALVWIVALWLPTSNLLYPLSYFAADRYMYAPLVGFCLLASCGVNAVWKKQRILGVALLMAVVGFFSWMTWNQNKFWQNELVFYRRILEVSPSSKEGLIGLGYYYMNAGELTKALSLFEEAERLSFGNARIYHNLGIVHQLLGHPDKAAGYLEKALAAEPGNVKALVSLGAVYDELGETQKAIEVLRKAVSLAPHHAQSYVTLGVVYERRGMFSEAEAAYRAALAERPDLAEAHFGLGVTLYRQGRPKEALADFVRAVDLDPRHKDALNNAVAVAVELGNLDVARRLLPRLRDVDPDAARALEKEIGGLRVR